MPKGKKMIRVTVNRKHEEIPEGMTVQELLDEKNKKRAVVWVNGKQLLKAEYPTHVIQAADHVKILRLVAGG